MHDTTALRRPDGSTSDNPRFVALQRQFPTVAYLRRRSPPPAAAFRVRVLRRRRRRRRRHRAQLERAQRGRAGAALWRHDGPAAGRYRAVRPPLRRADRRCAHGRAVAGLSRRRPVSRRGRAACERALHARPRRRHDGRAGRRDRARRALVPALSLLAQRARDRLRSRQARRCGRRQGAGAHARRAGAHHALARSGGRHRPRRSVPTSRCWRAS